RRQPRLASTDHHDGGTAYGGHGTPSTEAGCGGNGCGGGDLPSPMSHAVQEERQTESASAREVGERQPEQGGFVEGAQFVAYPAPRAAGVGGVCRHHRGPTVPPRRLTNDAHGERLVERGGARAAHQIDTAVAGQVLAVPTGKT